MNEVVTVSEINDRRGRYYMDNQVGIYSIVLSIALGVAGLAFASLLYITDADRPYRIFFWLLWLTSLGAVAVVYSGMNVNVFALPSKIPDPVDIFLPFAMALLEFMLFAVLTRPLTDQIPGRLIIAIWFGCFAAFGLLACLVITRARSIFKNATYDKNLEEGITRVIGQMHTDLRGAAGSSVIGVIGAIALASSPVTPMYITYILTPLIIASFIGGFSSHNKQRSALESALDQAAVGTNRIRVQDVPSRRARAIKRSRNSDYVLNGYARNQR
jgi:hypothetical protein